MTEAKELGKLLDLREAIRRFVKPGMKLHLAGGIGGPSAAICEIIRQYWGRNPGFTLIEATVTGHALNSAPDGETLADTGTERTDRHAETGSKHAHREKAHLYYSFLCVIS